MGIRKRKLPVLLVIVGVLLLLLPLLAYLQYDWLGKVSEREREQMQTALRRTLSQFSRDFDREIARIFIQFQNRPDQIEQLADNYVKVYKHWSSTAPHPRLIRDVFLEQSEAIGERRLQRLNASSQMWEPADWITEFGSRRELGEPVDVRVPAIVVELLTLKPPLPNEGFSFPTGSGRVIIRLNVDYIQQEFVPALVRSHFANANGEYRLQIISEEDGPRVIYSSEPGALIAGDGDATEPLLQLRPDEFRNFSLAGEPFVAAVPGTRVNVNSDRLFSIHLGTVGMAHLMPGEPISELSLTGWKVTAVHRLGSLDNAVQQLRRRNLAMSFSILALLTASVAIVLVSTARAQRLANRQMEFVSAVSHELRTPLAVICSAGENLADGIVRDADHLKSYGAVLRNEGRRLTEMVEQILSFAGVHSALKKQTFVPVDLANVVARAGQALESTLQEKCFTVDTRVMTGLPMVMGDAASLTRAVQNLISNAIKYSDAERWIGVSVFTEGGFVKIAVQDRGPGVAPSDLPHIFEPFYRGRSAVEGQIQGSGIGLSLVKQAVDAHGGRIDVSSDRGVGSTFCISLPIANPPETASK